MKSFLQICLLLLSFAAFANGQFAEKYRVELVFERPGYKEGKKELLYKWHRTVEFRTDFHFFLDRAPLKEGFTTGSIAGVIYPKKGELYCTLSLGAVKEVKLEAVGNGYSIGEAKFFKIPKSMNFELPLSEGSGFQKCTVTIVPIKS